MVNRPAPVATPQPAAPFPDSFAAWSRAIAQPAAEFDLQPLPILAGQLPTGLRGSLYRNGPARFERGGLRLQHWFDGDGAILAVHFDGSTAQGVYRYVHTPELKAETQADHLLYNNYGTLPPGAVWQRWGKPIKNVANTSVLALPDRLLALWEGERPYGLDLHNLTTLGVQDLGCLRPGATYSAHPKVDPHTGTIYNFGVRAGATTQLQLYTSDRSGRIIQQNAIPLSGIPLIHDYVMAGAYLIFCIPPIRLNPWLPLFSLQSFGDALQWQPQQGTEILVVDRESLSLVSRRQVEPWFQWHFGNGYVIEDPQERVVMECVRYGDFQTNQHLKEVASGQLHTTAPSGFWQFHLNPQTAEILDSYPLLDQTCEFPIVDPRQVGQPHSFTYLAVHRPTADVTRELFGAIARIDSSTGTVTMADLGANRYPVEPIYVSDADDPNQGWVLTVVFDGNHDRSEVLILASDRLDAEPVCRLGLPSIVPMGFHGSWRSAM